ncbi:Mrp/NBP35 family ATP-binding protein [bacterium]|nr:Mrp/NBP35 family ATP-binding protein [bacterium]
MKADEKTASECETCESETCSAKQMKPGEDQKIFDDRQKIKQRLCRIKHKIVVLSGKGGVGKSTVAVNTAFALARAGYRVGLMDADIHGPSIPTMLNLSKERVTSNGVDIEPVSVGPLKVVSIGFFLPHPDDPVIWRGPMKMGVIQQFLRDVVWDDLDYLIIDAPPGTGDEPLTICQSIDDLAGAIIVTTPQEVALAAVRKSVNFCKQANVKILGVVENMSGWACEKCGHPMALFPEGGGEKMATAMGVPFMGRLPLEPVIAHCGDAGEVFVGKYAGTVAGKAFTEIIQPLLGLAETKER